MVALECPLCGEEVQLDDGATGLFLCPHCDGEFEWGPQRDAYGQIIGSFFGFFFITTLVFFCISFGMFFFDGYQLDEALGWTFFLAIIGWAVIPFGVGMVFSDLNVGVLYLFAISSLGVLGSSCQVGQVTPNMLFLEVFDLPHRWFPMKFQSVLF